MGKSDCKWTTLHIESSVQINSDLVLILASIKYNKLLKQCEEYETEIICLWEKILIGLS